MIKVEWSDLAAVERRSGAGMEIGRQNGAGPGCHNGIGRGLVRNEPRRRRREGRSMGFDFEGGWNSRSNLQFRAFSRHAPVAFCTTLRGARWRQGPAIL